MAKLEVNTALYEQSQPAISHREKELLYSPEKSNGIYLSPATDCTWHKDLDEF